MGSENAGTTSLNSVGFIAGGGLEHALGEQFSLRFEALHFGFSRRVDTRSLSSDSDPGDFARIKGVSLARIGFSYRFASGVR